MQMGRMALPLFCTLALVGLGFSEDVPTGKYMGSAKCKNCHSTAAKGDQFDAWLKTKHAKAFEQLASPEAIKLGKTKGVDQPQKSAECLKCHVTAYEVPAAQKHKNFDATMGVQCESCHGPGSKHVEARLAADEAAAGDKPIEVGKDEIIGHPGADTCRKCHNKDGPSYKPFAFKKYLKEIAHLDPRKKRPADYQDKIPDDPKDDPEAEKIEFKK